MEWHGIVPLVSAAQASVDLARRSCYADLQPAVTKRIGMAARHKASVMLQLLCYAGLQREVARRSVTAAGKVVFQHGATFALCGIAAGSCKTQCAGCAKRRLGCRSYREVAEAVQSKSNTDKMLLKEEVAERRAASAKRSLSEEVAQQRSSSPMHPSTHPSIHHSFIHRFIGSWIHGFMDSVITGSLIH